MLAWTRRRRSLKPRDQLLGGSCFGDKLSRPPSVVVTVYRAATRKAAFKSSQVSLWLIVPSEPLFLLLFLIEQDLISKTSFTKPIKVGERANPGLPLSPLHHFSTNIILLPFKLNRLFWKVLKSKWHIEAGECDRDCQTGWVCRAGRASPNSRQAGGQAGRGNY